ncbi:MAG: cation-translocating P-type ATPase C-terminal domain-containing protein, partial [Candidatus Pacebacteria bacterium]|nr:cation-translocating P-type ATPase C-terminal domain-containing protein [Candidatus Paceibacterota bacterium]
FSFRSLYRPIFSYNPFSNKNLNIAILISFGLLIITMTVPFMRNIFDLAPLPPSWFWLIAVWIIFNISLVESAKWIFKKRIKFLRKRHS